MWRLQEEQHIRKVTENGKTFLRHVPVLVRRDKDGHIRGIATTETDKKRARQWWEFYNVHERLETLLAVRKLKTHIRFVKRRIRKRGFTFQISTYGIYKDPQTGRRYYCRYEIFRADKWTQADVTAIHDIFKAHKPKSAAGCFIFHDGRLFIEPTDKVTRLGVEVLGYTGERKDERVLAQIESAQQ